MNYGKILRNLRTHIFSYEGKQEIKADRVIAKVKEKHLKQLERKPAPTGPFSGLTRGELAKSGTCEPDWF